METVATHASWPLNFQSAGFTLAHSMRGSSRASQVQYASTQFIDGDKRHRWTHITSCQLHDYVGLLPLTNKKWAMLCLLGKLVKLQKLGGLNFG